MRHSCMPERGAGEGHVYTCRHGMRMRHGRAGVGCSSSLGVDVVMALHSIERSVSWDVGGRDDAVDSRLSGH